MDIEDYLLETDDVDWSEVLSPWSWSLPEEVTIWLMNRYGDLFLIMEGDAVHMLDVGIGTLKQLADSPDDFSDLLGEGDNANQWLMIPLVDSLVSSGQTLEPGQCYGYAQLPVFGGEYSVENTIVLPLDEHYSVTGSVHEQIKDVPDGEEVEIEIVTKREE